MAMNSTGTHRNSVFQQPAGVPQASNIQQQPVSAVRQVFMQQQQQQPAFQQNVIYQQPHVLQQTTTFQQQTTAPVPQRQVVPRQQTPAPQQRAQQIQHQGPHSMLQTSLKQAPVPQYASNIQHAHTFHPNTGFQQPHMVMQQPISINQKVTPQVGQIQTAPVSRSPTAQSINRRSISSVVSIGSSQISPAQTVSAGSPSGTIKEETSSIAFVAIPICGNCKKNLYRDDHPFECLSCAASKQTTLFCQKCFVTNITHIHDRSDFICDSDETWIDNNIQAFGWEVRKTAAGRTWYHQKSVNRKTFTSPIITNPAQTQFHPQLQLQHQPEPQTQTQSNLQLQVQSPQKPEPVSHQMTVYLSLPLGWEELKDPDGCTFYRNSRTHETTWWRPTPGKPIDGWTELKNPDGRPYYFHAESQTITWDHPGISSNSENKYNTSVTMSQASFAIEQLHIPPAAVETALVKGIKSTGNSAKATTINLAHNKTAQKVATTAGMGVANGVLRERVGISLGNGLVNLVGIDVSEDSTIDIGQDMSFDTGQDVSLDASQDMNLGSSQDASQSTIQDASQNEATLDSNEGVDIGDAGSGLGYSVDDFSNQGINTQQLAQNSRTRQNIQPGALQNQQRPQGQGQVRKKPVKPAANTGLPQHTASHGIANTAISIAAQSHNTVVNPVSVKYQGKGRDSSSPNVVRSHAQPHLINQHAQSHLNSQHAHSHSSNQNAHSHSNIQHAQSHLGNKRPSAKPTGHDASAANAGHSTIPTHHLPPRATNHIASTNNPSRLTETGGNQIHGSMKPNNPPITHAAAPSTRPTNRLQRQSMNQMHPIHTATPQNQSGSVLASNNNVQPPTRPTAPEANKIQPQHLNQQSQPFGQQRTRPVNRRPPVHTPNPSQNIQLANSNLQFATALVGRASIANHNQTNSGSRPAGNNSENFTTDYRANNKDVNQAVQQAPASDGTSNDVYDSQSSISSYQEQSEIIGRSISQNTDQNMNQIVDQNSYQCTDQSVILNFNQSLQNCDDQGAYLTAQDDTINYGSQENEEADAQVVGSDEQGQYNESGEVYDGSSEAYIESSEAQNESGEVYDGSSEAYIKSSEAQNESGEVYDGSSEAYIKSSEAQNESGEVYDGSSEAYIESSEAQNESGEVCIESGEAHNESGEVNNEPGEMYIDSGEVHYESSEACNESGGVYDDGSGQTYDGPAVIYSDGTGEAFGDSTGAVYSYGTSEAYGEGAGVAYDDGTGGEMGGGGNNAYNGAEEKTAAQNGNYQDQIQGDGFEQQTVYADGTDAGQQVDYGTDGNDSQGFAVDGGYDMWGGGGSGFVMDASFVPDQYDNPQGNTFDQQNNFQYGDGGYESKPTTEPRPLSEVNVSTGIDTSQPTALDRSISSPPPMPIESMNTLSTSTEEITATVTATTTVTVTPTSTSEPSQSDAPIFSSLSGPLFDFDYYEPFEPTLDDLLPKPEQHELEHGVDTQPAIPAELADSAPKSIDPVPQPQNNYLAELSASDSRNSPTIEPPSQGNAESMAQFQPLSQQGANTLSVEDTTLSRQTEDVSPSESNTLLMQVGVASPAQIGHSSQQREETPLAEPERPSQQRDDDIQTQSKPRYTPFRPPQPEFILPTTSEPRYTAFQPRQKSEITSAPVNSQYIPFRPQMQTIQVQSEPQHISFRSPEQQISPAQSDQQHRHSVSFQYKIERPRTESFSRGTDHEKASPTPTVFSISSLHQTVVESSTVYGAEDITPIATKHTEEGSVLGKEKPEIGKSASVPDYDGSGYGDDDFVPPPLFSRPRDM